MPDNLHHPEPGFFRLHDTALVTLRGPDAAVFAHAQFASDITALPSGQWQWSTWLTAKGRVILICMLCRLAEDEILLVLPDDGAEDAVAQLKRFVFRRKLSIEIRTDLAALGGFASPPVSGAAIGQQQDRWVFDVGSTALPRTLVVAASLPEASDDADAALRWRMADLRLGLPRLAPEQREQWTPQQIGLDRLQAYSVKKGCYPGQEIVARTHFLGKAKRATRLLETSVPASAGNEVRQRGQVIGSVASTAGTLALAVLPLETADDGLDIGDLPAHIQPFIEGLAR